MNVAIISYGTGNIASLGRALRSLGVNSYLAETKNDLVKANSIIFPGVGHFANAANNLEKSGLREYIKNLILDGIPTLGICLGFQLLTLSSEESINLPGLGFLPFYTIRLKVENKILNKIPHLGWNTIHSSSKESKLLNGIDLEEQIFYYSNAFGVLKSDSPEYIQASYIHEKELIALVEYKNIYGVQFHPEKSRQQGLKLLKNFLRQ